MTQEQFKRIWRSGERLEEWTNAQLDLERRADDDARAESRRLQRIADAEAFIRDAEEGRLDATIARVNAMQPRDFWEGYWSGREEWGEPVRATQKVKRKVGRPKGSAPEVVKAYADVARIKDIWQKTFGTHYRTASPTAIYIAAHRHGLTPEQLDNYRKNRNGR